MEEIDPLGWHSLSPSVESFESQLDGVAKIYLMTRLNKGGLKIKSDKKIKTEWAEAERLPLNSPKVLKNKKAMCAEISLLAMKALRENGIGATCVRVYRDYRGRKTDHMIVIAMAKVNYGGKQYLVPIYFDPALNKFGQKPQRIEILNDSEIIAIFFCLRAKYFQIKKNHTEALSNYHIAQKLIPDDLSLIHI